MTIMDPQKKGTSAPKHYKRCCYTVTGYITCDEFLQFIHDIPEDQLSPVLAFTILPDDGGHHSEHSSQHTQPI